MALYLISPLFVSVLSLTKAAMGARFKLKVSTLLDNPSRTEGSRNTSLHECPTSLQLRSDVTGWAKNARRRYRRLILCYLECCETKSSECPQATPDNNRQFRGYQFLECRLSFSCDHVFLLCVRVFDLTSIVLNWHLFVGNICLTGLLFDVICDDIVRQSAERLIRNVESWYWAGAYH